MLYFGATRLLFALFWCNLAAAQSFHEINALFINYLMPFSSWHSLCFFLAEQSLDLRLYRFQPAKGVSGDVASAGPSLQTKELPLR